MWQNYFDHIFLINLPDRVNKKERALAELGAYGITPEVYPAIRHEKGALGLFMTMQQLFSREDVQGKRVLVFEDDVKIVRDPGPIMDKCVASLQGFLWDLFYLGPNTHLPFGYPVADSLLQLFNAYSTHAVAYTGGTMKTMLKWKWEGTPVDVMMANLIQPEGNCYCSFPLIATQRNGFSDIENREVAQDYIEERFYKHTQHLRYGNL